MSASMPNATHTFNLLRKPIGSTTFQTITSNLSIYLEPKNQWIDSDRGGQLVTGVYDGVAPKFSGIIVKDVLQDTNDVNNRGEYVQYEVVESFSDMLFLNLIVHRSDS